ncbi:hypothetical protein EVAR_99252_1 [Eumeta japonica]|uniref:Uncharacterized protein n=1 Tax=Eumeta variegata TaxID=151549 RepID=A0A4C2A0F7_EUMVA|nr:hypothetical protein EVAR_99252_1 [Eumeta japonica]
METNTSCPPGAGGVPKGPVTRALIKSLLLKSLAEAGYECPEGDLDKFVRKTTPVSSRASSQATSPASSQSSSRSHSPVKGGKKRNRKSSSSSEEETTGTGSDSTVVGTDESESESGKSSSKSDSSFTLVKGKNKKQIRKALKKSKVERNSPVRDMEVEISQKVTSPTPAATVADPPSPRPVTTSTQVATDRVANTGAKPSAPPKGKAPPIYLLKGANFVRISADCTTMPVITRPAVRVADDSIHTAIDQKPAPPKRGLSITGRRRVGLIRNDANFPELRAKPTRDAPAAFRPAPHPHQSVDDANCSTAERHLAAAREAQRSPVPPPVSATAGSSSFGDDIQTVMAVLRGFELGDRRVREPAPSMPQRGGKTRSS